MYTQEERTILKLAGDEACYNDNLTKISTEDIWKKAQTQGLLRDAFDKAFSTLRQKLLIAIDYDEEEKPSFCISVYGFAQYMIQKPDYPIISQAVDRQVKEHNNSDTKSIALAIHQPSIVVNFFLSAIPTVTNNNKYKQTLAF